MGMAYGIISTTVLLSLGVPPATASATTHMAELATTAASGTSHIVARNVNWKLFFLLTPFGVLGGIAGAYLLVSIDGKLLKPFILTYLGVMGIVILWRAFAQKKQRDIKSATVPPLGAFAGFADAIGGGGWGPIMTSTLLASGGEPRRVIGTVNTAEFLVTLAISSSFVFALVTGNWNEASSVLDHVLQIAGLVVGGLLAAPIAGIAVKHVQPRPLTIAVGLVVMITTSFQAAKLFGWI